MVTTPTESSSLRDALGRLPRDVYGYVVGFLTPTMSTRRLYAQCIALVPIARTTMKRCTLCEGCHRHCTYNRLCRDCDINQWFDIPYW